MSESGRVPRTCLGCRQVRPQHELLRYVAGPDRALVCDYRKRLPGRGAYTCPSLDCLRQAIKRRQFHRSLKDEQLQLDAGRLLQGLRGQILQRVENLVGMARKSGQLVGGSNQLLAELGRGNLPALILLATDVSAGIGEKIRQRSNAAGLPLWQLMTKEQLGGLLGRDERSVIGVWRGKLGDALLAELQCYEDFAGEI